ncbi:MAG: stage II sporulation protein P [Oscillospiraceae bacterium]|nr:stage II sporulation protein P [Oscillospiraceae bacterium]
MGEGKKLALLGMCVLCVYMLFHRDEKNGPAEQPVFADRAAVQTVTAEKEDENEQKTAAIHGPASTTQEWEETLFVSSGAEAAVGMTIGNDAMIKNETDYPIDAAAILSGGTAVRLPAGQPQILIIHTHSSEAYTPAGLDRYEASDHTRTEDSEHNIIRVGDELTKQLEAYGLNVIHDRGVYDYPSYTGSYTRSGQAVAQYLKDYPSIGIVLDVHRDALGTDDVIYKTVAEETGSCASQVMLLSGTDESGLEHPNWRENLSLALYLQNAVLRVHPTLMRPVDVVPQRYNQQLCSGMLIVEVGSSGNTMQEALAAIRLFAEGAGPALLQLVE